MLWMDKYLISNSFHVGKMQTIFGFCGGSFLFSYAIKWRKSLLFLGKCLAINCCAKKIPTFEITTRRRPRSSFQSSTEDIVFIWFHLCRILSSDGWKEPKARKFLCWLFPKQCNQQDDIPCGIKGNCIKGNLFHTFRLFQY